jgi:hypothetical protein
MYVSRALRDLPANWARGPLRRTSSMPPALAATGAAHRAAAELSIASGEAILHKGFAVRPVDNVGQGAAVLVALVLLRIAECQERTISLGAGLPGAKPQQTDDQRRCKKSHRFDSPPRSSRDSSIPEKLKAGAIRARPRPGAHRLADA